MLKQEIKFKTSQSRLIGPADGDDQNVALMKKLYAKLEQSFTGDSNAPMADSSFLMLQNPGFIIKPGFDPGLPADRKAFARFLDRIPSSNCLYKPLTRLVPEIWELVLRDRVLSQSTITPAEQQELSALRTELNTAVWDPSIGANITPLKRYEQLRRAYNTAAYAYYSANKQQLNDPSYDIPPDVLSDYQDALTDWTQAPVGAKDDVEAKEGRVATLENKDPNLYWQNLQNKYTTSVTGAGGFAPTVSYPAREDWLTAGDWITFQFVQAEWDKQTNSSHTEYGGGFGVDFGLWSFSAGADYESDHQYAQSSTSNFSVKFDLMVAEIDRDDWIDSTALSLRNWTLPSSDGPISDGGDPATGRFPAGLMPFLPSSLLLAKNLEITAGFTQQEADFAQSKMSGGGSIGWGCFSIGGYYEQDQTSSHVSGQIVGNTIKFPDPQVIGWFSQVLPVCPNPDNFGSFKGGISMDLLPQYNKKFVDTVKSQKKK